MPDIVSLGECMVELFSDEPIGAAPYFHKSFAGDTLNMLFMASTLGTPCGYITRLGEDPFAQYLVDEMRGQGIDSSGVKLVPGFTGVHFVSLLPKGGREFVYYRKGSAASTMTPDDLDVEYIGRAKVLHISAIPQAISASARATVVKAAQIAKERDVTVSYDTNLRPSLWTIEEAREAMHDVLPYVDIVFPSHPEDTGPLIGASSEAEVVQFFKSRGVDTVAVKRGESGAWVATQKETASVSALAPQGVLDTTGAGDAFVGGFLHCIVQGLDAFEAARWGTASAGLKVAGRGAVASQPSREQVESHVGQVQVLSPG